MYFNINKEELVAKNAIHTATEICQQPNTWQKTLKQIADEKDAIKKFIDQVITKEDFDIILTGAGTSEFVGNAAFAYLSQLYNHKVKSYGTTDIVATPEAYLSKTKPTLLVSYGRSGNSPESVGAVEVANVVCENVYHLFITCNPEGALSKIAEKLDNAYAINLTPETHDKGFAMTSSFTNMYLGTLLALQLDEYDNIKPIIDKVCESVTKVCEEDFILFDEIVKEYDFKRIVYLGSNSLKGIAQESALKLLELAAGKTVTMHDTPLGFRHGPKSIVNDDTLTVIYLSDDKHTYKYEIDLLKEMSAQRKGNKILAISNIYQEEAMELADYYYSFNNQEMNNAYIGLEYIACAQIISVFKSLKSDIMPDTPCPTGEVNRVVQGVTIYEYTK